MTLQLTPGRTAAKRGRLLRSVSGVAVLATGLAVSVVVAAGDANKALPVGRRSGSNRGPPFPKPVYQGTGTPPASVRGGSQPGLPILIGRERSWHSLLSMTTK